MSLFVQSLGLSGGQALVTSVLREYCSQVEPQGGCTWNSREICKVGFPSAGVQPKHRADAGDGEGR